MSRSMPFEVIMPALGMAQETGRLVAWLKGPGEKIAADDPLMEVETDKTTMEVPAGAEGILTDVRAKAGEDIPVGQVVALIAAEGEDVPTAEEMIAPTVAEARAPEPGPKPEPARRPNPVPAPTPYTPPPARRSAPDGRVLASPKARRLAHERGMNLARLAASGRAQPFHAADVEASRDNKAAGTSSLASAQCSAQAFDALLAAMAEGVTIRLDPHILAASFVASAYRAASDAESVVVAVETGPRLDRSLYLDPDFTRPSRPRIAPKQSLPTVIFRDLSGTCLTGLSLGGDEAPSLTLCRVGGDFMLSLSFQATDLNAAQAIAFVSGVAERLTAPLRNLA